MSDGRRCNVGWSEAFLAAMRQVLLRHGKVVSTSEENGVRLRLGAWELSSYPRLDQYSWMRPWEVTQDRPLSCGQCAICSTLTPAHIRRTAANLDYLDTQDAHILEDAIMRDVLQRIADGDQGEDPVALAQAACSMFATRRVRWYA